MQNEQGSKLWILILILIIIALGIIVLWFVLRGQSKQNKLGAILSPKSRVTQSVAPAAPVTVSSINPNENKVGGCTSEDYLGTCTVTSVKADQEIQNDVGFTFSLSPGQKNPKIDDLSKEHLMDLCAFGPTKEQIQKLGIVPGKKYSCILWKTITGACPLYGFKFPSLDTDCTN